MWTTEDRDPLKWRFYHASHSPDRAFQDEEEARTAATFDPGQTNGLQVEDLSLGDQVNGDLSTMHSGLVDYDFLAGRGSPRTPVKAIHDLSMVFPDNDSGFGSYKSKSRLLSSDDFTPSPSRLSRSRSLSRLNGLTTQEMADVLEKPARSLQSALEDSESRRTVLMHKLKEAQATLELQNDRLSKIENAAKDNNSLVEDLKFKEREYRKKIAQLQKAEEEKSALQMENVRLREEMQDRIDSLDFQLKTLKNQHQSTEDDNERRMCLLDQTSQALTLLEEENTRLQMDRDKLREEISLMKEAFQLSKTRYDSVESENKSHKSEAEKLREENLSLNKRVHEMAGQMMELRNLLQAVKDDNERLSTSWRNANEDKHRASRQVEGYQDTLADLKSRLAAATADKDRLFQERLDLNQKVQQLILEKEQLLKSQMVLEEQVTEQETALQRSKSSTYRQDDERKQLRDELAAVKRVSEDLSTELASVKAFYERALEQLSLAENAKKVQEQQVQLAEQERKRLQNEVDRLSKVLDGHHRDDREERQHLEDTILKMRSEMKDLKFDKEQLTNKNHELDTKLQKANEEIRSGMGKKFDDLESWKTTCDRLTASVTRKETELQNLSDKCHSLENQLARAEEELRHSRETNELASDTRDELERLRDENRRLLQEKAENEQMLQLLETQRDVLTKSTESGLNKMQDVEQLSGKVDQMRNENEVLRERILELEKVRDNLIKQKEDLLASSELIYKSQGLEELEGKMEELREANKQLRDINEVMANKLQVVEQENLRLKHAMGDASSKEELKRLREENQRLLGETTKLRQENSQYVSQTSKETEAAGKEFHKIRKERDALQKQVQLINGQLNLLEGSKRRSDETAQRSQEELAKLRTQLETSRKECAEAKRVSTQVRSLSEQLQRAKEKQENQEKLIRTMKEELHEERSKKPAQIQESLEDVGAELQQMRGELHKLMGEIENKEQTIEQLEAELRTAQDSVDSKEHSLKDLKKLVADLEQQNSTLKSSMEHQRHGDSSGDEKPAFVIKTGERTLKEELEEAVKSKHNRSGDHRPRSLVRSKSLIPVKHGEGYHARLTITKDEPLKELSSKQMDDRAEAKSEGKRETKSGFLSVPESSKSSASAASTPRLGTVTPTPPETPMHSAPQSRFTYSDSQSKLNLQISETSASAEQTTTSGEGKDTTDFPPLTPPSPEDGKLKLVFSKPPPPAAVKHRRLPQVKAASGSHLAKAVMIRQAVTKQVEGIIASEVQSDSVSAKSGQKTSSGPEGAASVSSLSKRSAGQEGVLENSQAEVAFSSRGFAAKPSRFLSESSSGVTKQGEVSAGDFSKAPKLIPQLETVSKPAGVSPVSKTDSTLMSFSELLSSENSSRASAPGNLSSGTHFSSGTSSGSDIQSKSQVDTPTKSRLSSSESGSILSGKASKDSRIPQSQSSSKLLNVPREQFGRAKPKSSSVRDFLATFSSGEKEEKKDQDESRGKLTGSSSRYRTSTYSGTKSSEKTQDSKKLSSGLGRSWTWHSLLSEQDTPGGSDKIGTRDETYPEDEEGPRSYAIFDPDSTDPWSMLLDEPTSLKAKMSSTLPTSSSETSSSQKNAEEGQPLKFKPATGLFLSKSLGHPISTLTSGESQSASGASGDTEPEKPATGESTDRLQSLISKYRSHSSDPLSGASSPVGGAKSRGGSAPPTYRAGGLSSPKGRSFSPGSPKAPLLTPSTGTSEETPSPKTGKKLPPPPPPKPGKSLMKSLSGGDGAAKPVGEGTSEQMLDSQEQSDINALIQKPSDSPPTKSLLSVHPPKITSTSKFLKCKREQRK